MIIVICGPTGVGKTRVSIEVAKKFSGEIVYADSGAVWKGLDIGTAKPSKLEREIVPHHLIDVKEPNEQFDVGQYVELADSAINQILARRKLPIVVGGTGLYIKALIYGIAKMPGRDEKFREKIMLNKPRLYNILKEKDPLTAKRLKPNDTPRIVRALEVLHLTGRTIGEFQMGFNKPRYSALKIGLNMERAELYKRIDQRVDKMASFGLFEEAAKLIERYGPDCQAFQAVGYKEIVQKWFKSGSTVVQKSKTVDEIKLHSRQYAKRQLTWFRGDRTIKWFDPCEIDSIENKIKNFLLT